MLALSLFCREPRTSKCSGSGFFLCLSDLKVGELRGPEGPPSSIHRRAWENQRLRLAGGLRPRRQGWGQQVSELRMASHRGSLELRAETECRGRAAWRISLPQEGQAACSSWPARIPGKGCGLPECLQLSEQWLGRVLTQSLTLGRRQGSLESLLGRGCRGSLRAWGGHRMEHGGGARSRG